LIHFSFFSSTTTIHSRFHTHDSIPTHAWQYAQFKPAGNRVIMNRLKCFVVGVGIIVPCSRTWDSAMVSNEIVIYRT
jgi:hypothetical protein